MLQFIKIAYVDLKGQRERCQTMSFEEDKGLNKTQHNRKSRYTPWIWNQSYQGTIQSIPAVQGGDFNVTPSDSGMEYKHIKHTRGKMGEVLKNIRRCLQ